MNADCRDQTYSGSNQHTKFQRDSLSIRIVPSSMNNPAVFGAGYAFLLFQDESSVQALIDACIEEDGKLYLCVSSPTIKDKPVSGKHKHKHLLTSELPTQMNLCLHVYDFVCDRSRSARGT